MLVPCVRPRVVSMTSSLSSISARNGSGVERNRGVKGDIRRSFTLFGSERRASFKWRRFRHWRGRLLLSLDLGILRFCHGKELDRWIFFVFVDQCHLFALVLVGISHREGETALDIRRVGWILWESGGDYIGEQDCLLQLIAHRGDGRILSASVGCPFD